jgi:hypothetical protein
VLRLQHLHLHQQQLNQHLLLWNNLICITFACTIAALLLFGLTTSIVGSHRFLSLKHIVP